MRTLQIGDRPTRLAQAVAELGRIDKTIHALTYIDDETKRRRILQQLNKGEDRHKLARAVFHRWFLNILTSWDAIPFHFQKP
jgi:TnpA family transposase